MIKVLGHMSEGMAAAAQDQYDDLKINDEIENTATYSTLKKIIKKLNKQEEQIEVLIRAIHGRDIMIQQFINDTRKELDGISLRAKRK